MPKVNGIPLFNTLVLEINSQCNRKCIFCPNHMHGEKRKPNQFLPMDTIKKVADELSGLKFAGRIEPFIFNEPLLDKRMLQIAELFYEEVPRASFAINTNGDKIRSSDDIRKLLEYVRAIEINVYPDGNPHQRHMEMSRWVSEIKGNSEYEFVDANIYQPISKKYRILYVADKINFTSLSGVHAIQNRAGAIPWLIPATPIPLQKMCVRPFRMLTVDYNGEAVLCCNDYFSSVKFGSLKNHTLMDIWRSKKLNRFRNTLLEKSRNLPLCRWCDFDGGVYQHMIKKHWSEFLNQEEN